MLFVLAVLYVSFFYMWVCLFSIIDLLEEFYCIGYLYVRVYRQDFCVGFFFMKKMFKNIWDSYYP